jgi:hypothetical protein
MAMDVRLSPLTVGAVIAIIVLLLCILAAVVPGLWGRTFVLGALAALAVARLT